jgi:lipopolysaccharide transport system ATP-binding protein
MSGRAIVVDGLGKKFAGIGRRPSRGFHDAVERLVRAPFWRYSRTPHQPNPEFWALRDVSFDLKYGEAVGVLGSNGAGKSVLLKILARVTAPSEGRAVVNGRIGPLLEVGAGFHSELTGRENVYLNGAILGMSRDEIRGKFDQIVAYSEIDAFIDAPVKVYSSGMRMRLAFSVAAHLDPEILLIDEAFAVGDASFREKCKRTIIQSIERGCSVLLVTHDQAIVAGICQRALLIENGRLVCDDASPAVLARYAKRRSNGSA